MKARAKIILSVVILVVLIVGGMQLYNWYQAPFIEGERRALEWVEGAEEREREREEREATQRELDEQVREQQERVQGLLESTPEPEEESNIAPHWAENYIVADEVVLIEMRVRTAWNLDAIIRGMYNDIVLALSYAQEHHEGLDVTIHILDDLVFPDGRVDYDVTVMRAMFTSEDVLNADIRHLRAFPEQVRDAASLFTVNQSYRQ